MCAILLLQVFRGTLPLNATVVTGYIAIVLIVVMPLAISLHNSDLLFSHGMESWCNLGQSTVIFLAFDTVMSVSSLQHPHTFVILRLNHCNSQFVLCK